MSNLFAYGSLMCSDIMQSVVNFLPESVTVSLSGYRRLAIKGQQYPGLCPGGKKSVQGRLYFDIPAEGWLRLDAFEGDMYSCDEVMVATIDGDRIGARVYVVKEAYRNLLTGQEWSYERFLPAGETEVCRIVSRV